MWATVGSFGGTMKSLLATVCFLTIAISALGQAAVEGALTHALSGATSTAAGKAMGQIGNQLAGKLGQQTSNAVSPRATAVRPAAQKGIKAPAAVTTTPATNTGSLIASIQGGETSATKTCAPQNPDKNGTTSQGVTDCTVTKTTMATDAHPSEITLPAPK